MAPKAQPLSDDEEEESDEDSDGEEEESDDALPSPKAAAKPAAKKPVAAAAKPAAKAASSAAKPDSAQLPPLPDSAAGKNTGAKGSSPGDAPLTEEEIAKREEAARKIQARQQGMKARKRVASIKQDKLLTEPRKRRDVAAVPAGSKSGDGTEPDESGSTKKTAVAVKASNFTRVPEGLAETNMCNSGKADFKAAFDMIDQAGAGVLNREQARKWLRCMGWCSPTHELDKVLNRGQPSVLVKSWDLSTLTSLAEKHAQRANGSVEDLQSALRKLAGNKARISRQRLLELSTAQSKLSAEQLQDIFNVIGVRATGTADCDSLAYSVLSRITQPPSLQERKEVEVV